MQAEFAERYRALIDNYCVPGKIHQGLVLSGAADNTPSEEHIIKFEAAKDTAIVYTEVRKADGWIQPHQFEFKRLEGNWFLDDVYYYYYTEGSGRYACL